jgi:hypothetical protein
MFEIIKKIKANLGDSNFVILWFEQLLFSALYGIAFHSWVVFGLMFLGSFWLLNRPRGTVHMIYAMSLLWGFIAFSIGHSISWGWATMLGMAFFLLGVGAHLTGLTKPVVSTIVSVNHENNEWRRNGYEGRQNLN